MRTEVRSKSARLCVCSVVPLCQRGSVVYCVSLVRVFLSSDKASLIRMSDIFRDAVLLNTGISVLLAHEQRLIEPCEAPEW